MSLNTQILSAGIEFREQPFAKPLQLSSGAISVITEATATVRVRVGNTEATGRGCIYLSDLWAWPDPRIGHEQRDAVLREFSTALAASLGEACGPNAAHPLELGLRLHHWAAQCALPSTATLPAELAGDDVVLPALARAMCASPFDAAIHDAVGHAVGSNAFDLYAEDNPIPSADKYFPGLGTVAAIRNVLMAPRESLDAWLVVGAADELPASLAPWIQDRGYRCFKLKTHGKDAHADAARTAAVYRAALELGLKELLLSIDSNEGNPDAASVAQYLETLEELDPQAYAALSYLEQPTGRDITRAAFQWQEIGRRKPLFLDEGLTSLELLETARAQGWNGLALKTCKGHSFMLVAAAWAHVNGMALAMQDLTNPGLAAIQSAATAARMPVINGIELNSVQFTPAANRRWAKTLPGLFEPREGVHRLPMDFLGLGSSLPAE